MGSRWLGIALLGCTLVLVMGASGAQAQVAAPSIVPGTGTQDNPAVIKWGAPSRIGFGVFSAKTVDQPGNVNSNYSGGDAGFRAVGETLAFGLSAIHMADQESTFKDVVDTATVNVALQTGNSFAWGLGYTSEKESQDFSETDAKQSVFGLSVRLGELWFVGGTVGRQSVSIKDTSIPLQFSAERDIIQYGLGFRRGGSVLVHLEVFGGYKNELKDAGLNFGSESTIGGTMEFTFGPILIAGSSSRSTYHNSGNEYSTFTTGDVGWAPRQGFSLVLHYEARYFKYDFASVGIDSHKEERTGVQLTWQF